MDPRQVRAQGHDVGANIGDPLIHATQELNGAYHDLAECVGLGSQGAELVQHPVVGLGHLMILPRISTAARALDGPGSGQYPFTQPLQRELHRQGTRRRG